MPIAPLKKKIFSGTSKIFDGTLERILNEIIAGVNAGGGGAGGPVAWGDVEGKPTEFPASAASVTSALAGKAEIAALETVSVADAVEPEDAVVLANANKAALNAIIAALKA